MQNEEKMIVAIELSDRIFSSLKKNTQQLLTDLKLISTMIDINGIELSDELENFSDKYYTVINKMNDELKKYGRSRSN